ncbi:DUF2294 domain-containing protein [Aneurinibacillus sp. Ricciae_BoGa-3]|uniref:DUF2294 domain-containing protein n=1 Tax=Aneurinibacillus sp. Ricciae_BoGa-3 TaxID=3022697 RepID=UPI00234158DA|nr:DUF2294 domain-containing protein [Aneurinibacillus sp. Ricciae_BoGa-3]WCK56696.1 DUF2294 domain-containing protein [Aneurinibacillus sp. Ricciae_BoGa-3]
MRKSKGATEAEISKALTQWEKNYLGVGAVAVKSDILRNMIIVQLDHVLTPAEYSLCKDKDGMLSVKKNRNGLVESGIEQIKEIIFTITGEEVVSFHTDISTNTGERLMVFKFAKNLEAQFS